MPTPRCCLAAGVIDGIFYAVEGATSSGGTGILEAYNPKTNTWTTKAPKPISAAHMSVAVVDSILYTIGGGFSVGNMVHAYDPKTNSWSNKTPMPTVRCCMAIGVIDGLIYVVGGYTALSPSGGVSLTTALEVYDPGSNTWTTKTAMPTARAGVSSGVIGGKLYVIGGTVGSLEAVRAVVEAYDPRTNTWSTHTPIPTPRSFAAAGVVDDTLYVVGGYPAGAANEAFSPFLPIPIDIKPGDANNTVNLRSNGTILVAILSSASFGATTVDPATVKFAGAAVATQGRGTPMTSVADLNRDGRVDLLLHFRTQDLQLTPASTEAVLKGKTFSGQLIRGTDSIRLVP